MPDTNVSRKHIDAALVWAESVKWAKCDAFDATTKFAEYCVKHDLVPTTVVKAMHSQYTSTVKTKVNDVLAAVKLLKHFGGGKAYMAEVAKYNDENVHVVYSHQTFARKFLKEPAQKKSAPKKQASLSDAVKQGIITAAQAKALKAMGF
jgi:hypothetical protein